MARPSWMTPSRVYPKQTPSNFWMLKQRAVKFHDLTKQRQCHGTVKSTGLRCQCVCVTGSDFCCKHGGIRNLEKRIQKVGGPMQRKHSVVSLSGQNIKKRLDVGAAFSLEEEIGQHCLPNHTRLELASMGLGARGRKYMEIIAQKDKYKQDEE